MEVPFLDLSAQHRPLRKEIDAAIAEVIDANAFAGGPFVEKFEEDFARFCQAKFCVAMGSGTEAIWLPLLAMGIGAGDEVVTVSSTFIATAEAITYTGAKPVFVDIDPVTYTLDPKLLEAAITPRTAAIIPVHLFGQTADMDPIRKIAAKHGLPVIEDACQAHGAEYHGRPAGTLGEVGCFSFYPGKNLGAFGEGGAAVTNDAELALKMKTLRDHGQTKKYHHQLVGWNCRMDGIQGAVLRIKLRHLRDGNSARRRNAQTYNALLQGAVPTPAEAAYAKHVYHIYAIRAANREDLMRVLAERKIGCGIHYPVPLHLQEAYHSLGYREGAFPVAERCAKEFLSLPMFPELTESQIQYTAETVLNALRTADSSAELAKA